MASTQRTRNSKTNSSILTTIGLFSVGCALGYTYYRKLYERIQRTDSRSQHKKSLQLDTSDVRLPSDIDDCFSVALSAAYAAGKIIKNVINDRTTKSASLLTKSNATDIVTQIDKQCEDIILSALRSSFPSHAIIAEESCKDPSQHTITDVPTWCVDPIDGTTNFLHGSPFVAVCIGLRIANKPVLGVVHCPILNETFYAILGRGAHCIRHNGGGAGDTTVKLQSNREVFNTKERMKQALILSEVGYDRSDKWVRCLTRRFHELLHTQHVRGIRCLGSCAINMCWIAMGRADIFFEGRNNVSGPKPWDFTAAEVIAYEAGGITVDPNGAPFDCTQGRVLCCCNEATVNYVLTLGLYKTNDQY